MIGIRSFGAYVPRLRLSRQSAIDALGMRLPDRAKAMPGERSVCAPDEDALTTAVEASRESLQGFDSSKVNAVFLASTTLPFADRKNAAILKTALGLGDALFSEDASGSLSAGCAALKTALCSVASMDAETALVAASDLRLARPGSLEELLYGDAAAAFLVGRASVIAEYVGSHSISRDVVSQYRMSGCDFDYKWEERQGLESVIVPLMEETASALLLKLGFRRSDVHRWVIPAPSSSAHKKIVRALGIEPDRALDPLIDTIGDTGTGHPLLMLARALETAAKPGQLIVCLGVGGGCDALCFRVTDEIEKQKSKQSVSRAISIREPLSHYAKFLAFRGAIHVDSGIRGEVETKTALSVLYREREMLTGFVGGFCEDCKTPQFPRSRVCVNPACRKFDAQVPYRFADKEATIRTFTADYLHPSDNPPSLYGLVDFDGGGRMPIEFCDCALEELGVGKRVRMVFRRRDRDEARDLVGYFWKATPIRDDRGLPR